jgi:hypothetical protein
MLDESLPTAEGLILTPVFAWTSAGCVHSQAAEKPFRAVILSRAKDLALSIFMGMRHSSFAMFRSACGSSG